MRDVEEAGLRPHGLVLVEDAAELHRQLPAAEIDHLAAELLFELVQGSFLQRLVGRRVIGHWVLRRERYANTMR